MCHCQPGSAAVCFLWLRVEPSHPHFSAVFRADLVLVDTAPWSSGGGPGRHGWRVGDCSAEGGTREGRVRNALGSMCFIARLPPIPLHNPLIPPYCALYLGPCPPSTRVLEYLSHRALLPVSRGEERGVLLRILYACTWLACTVEWCPLACLPGLALLGSATSACSLLSRLLTRPDQRLALGGYSVPFHTPLGMREWGEPTPVLSQGFYLLRISSRL